MKLSELKIETYSDQLTERELTEVKGGTTPLGAAVLAIAVAAAVVITTKPPEGDQEMPRTIGNGGLEG